MENPALNLRAPGVGARPTTSSRVRVSRWRGQPFIAQVSPSRSRRQTETGDVVECLATLTQRGVTKALTPALSAWDCQPFLSAGFKIHEHLHLLTRSLDEIPARSSHKTRTAMPWHRSGALAVDAASFEPFWRFDEAALLEACRATPQHRFRVLLDEKNVVGYAINGRAGGRGYLQRLAVLPEYQGQGMGTALINDGFGWLKRKGVTEVLVNTQEHNQRALELYLHLGFVLQKEKLSVLTWTP